MNMTNKEIEKNVINIIQIEGTEPDKSAIELISKAATGSSLETELSKLKKYFNDFPLQYNS